MKTYKLYIESGPKMKTTMVHVLDLLGCIANGPTTESALEATPGEIREFLRFLKKHGEDTDPDADFKPTIEAHVMEGSWIGQGDPAPGFAPDFEPVAEKDERTYRNRFAWLIEEFVGLIKKAQPRLTDTPDKGRPIRDIVAHVANAQVEYLRASGIGKPERIKEALGAIEGASPAGLGKALADEWRLLDSQIAAITPAVRKAQIQRGEKLWTARRGFRRALEHAWEHLREIERRLEPTKGADRR